MHPSALIDEIDERTLRAELAAREERRRVGLCDYCSRRPDTNPCKFPERHHDKRIHA